MALDENSMSDAVTMRPGDEGALGRIDQYTLVCELGGGGFGTVYLAKDTVSGVEYAVKGLPPMVRNSGEEMENVRANFALVSRLSHTHIARAYVLHPTREVTYFDPSVRAKLRVDPGDTLMVMEYAPGVTLSKWRRQFPDGKVPLKQALEIVRQVAAALDYAHGERILHRDVKPANVVVETKPDGSLVARVLDFGLAAEIRSSMGRVSREIHDTSGTRPYMAPEQWLGNKQVPATDQYALAVLFHELVTGAVPFASLFDTGDPVLMMTVVTTRAPEIPADLPEPVRLALALALAKKPDERFPSCTAFVDALTGGAQLVAPAPGGSRSRVTVGILAAAALALTAIGGWWLFRMTSMQDEEMRAPRIGTTNAAHVVRSTTATTGVPPVKQGPTKKIILPGGVKMEMAYVEPGSFMKGKRGEKKHRERIAEGFWLGKYEVTQAQWEAVMGKNPSDFKGINNPVEQVSWDDCQKFLEKLNALPEVKESGWTCRLPTEKEWEYACQAGSTGDYCKLADGTEITKDTLGEVAWYDDNSGDTTHPVGLKKPNTFGLYDMHGNVWEWCEDLNRAGGSYRVHHGGSWSLIPECCESFIRGCCPPSDRGNFLGFRLAASQDVNR